MGINSLEISQELAVDLETVLDIQNFTKGKASADHFFDSYLETIRKLRAGKIKAKPDSFGSDYFSLRIGRTNYYLLLFEIEPNSYLAYKLGGPYQV